METIQLEAAAEVRIREVAEHWSGFLLREVFGDAVDSMDLEMMDEAAAFCGDVLAQKMAEALLRRRGEPLTEEACPECGRVCEVKPKDRRLLLRRGPVEWAEPKSRCPGCQRDFFPLASCPEG